MDSELFVHLFIVACLSLWFLMRDDFSEPRHRCVVFVSYVCTGEVSKWEDVVL